MLYGMRMVQKLTGLRNWKSLPKKVQLRILMQTFFTMFSCAFCYILRSIMIILEYHSICHEEKMIETSPIWWFGAIWIPTVVPSCLLLFTMRNLDKPRDPALLKTTQPSGHNCALNSLPERDEHRWSSFSRSVYGEGGSFEDVVGGSSGEEEAFNGAGARKGGLRESLTSSLASGGSLQEPLLKENDEVERVVVGGGGGGRARSIEF